jgi:hypothetical protein
MKTIFLFLVLMILLSTNVKSECFHRRHHHHQRIWIRPVWVYNRNGAIFIPGHYR